MFRRSLRKTLRHCVLVALMFRLILSGLSTAEETGATAIGFNRDVRPILSKHCFTCHGLDENKREAELRLDVQEDATRDLGGYAAIVPGKPDESELWHRITSSDTEIVMPPSDTHTPLSLEEKSVLRQWIIEGAKYEGHWSFIRPEKPTVPKFESESTTNPIDTFILKELRDKKIEFSAEADKPTLIRRVTLDLTGLPPTPVEVDAFLADNSEDAYERLVDDLQNRVSYGEHMARYWLDLARYADTHGLHLDNERSMWPYRDWVVRAFCENVPFDDFARWQLAGDLLPTPTRDQLIASGFNRCNVTTGEGGSIAKEWIFRYAVERTSATAEVFMGLTAGCAVCHDHKFDPLSSKEFYSLYAFFHSAADPAMDGNKLDTPPILKLTTPADEEKLADFDTQITELKKEIAEVVASHEYVEPIDEAAVDDSTQSFAKWKTQSADERERPLPNALKAIAKRETPSWSDEESQQIQRAWLRHVYAGLKPKIDKLNDEVSKVEKAKQEYEKAIPLTFVMADLDKPRESHVMLRGAYDKPGEKVTRNVPAFLPSLPAKDSGQLYNRLDLANWLLSRDHPLTARVTVNRFWQQFFGRGLVETSEDFGTQGRLPTHPELLDWLAVQFIDDGWDMKKLVRRIVTSRTYRQSSKVSPELARRDPNNRLLARGPRLRLDAEILRDQALFVGGLLVSKVGGKGVQPYQPPNIWEPVAFGGSNTRFYKQGSGDDLYRRSLYTFLKRTAPPPFMSTFDAPNREQVCSRRGRSNTPMQALQLMNDVQHVEAARGFAQRMLKDGGDRPEGRIRWAWRAATARWPDTNEIAVVMSLLQTTQDRYRKAPGSAAQLIQFGESKPDERVETTELAAYTMVANLILNLDETVNKN